MPTSRSSATTMSTRCWPWSTPRDPGPFKARTIELGTYLGIRENGRLVAMAGERLWIGNFREVSAVCTHPDARGRGYARALVARVVNLMLKTGERRSCMSAATTPSVRALPQPRIRSARRVPDPVRAAGELAPPASWHRCCSATCTFASEVHDGHVFTAQRCPKHAARAPGRTRRHCRHNRGGARHHRRLGRTPGPAGRPRAPAARPGHRARRRAPHYLERGAGTPVVLLHGIRACRRLRGERTHRPARCPDYRVIAAFDRPGFGYSERPRDRLWTAEAQAALMQGRDPAPGPRASGGRRALVGDADRARAREPAPEDARKLVLLLRLLFSDRRS